MKTIVLIPALNPDEKTLRYVNELNGVGFDKIIVINDGSSADYDGVFDELAKVEGVTVLTHKVNQGKGRGLKTGFNHILKEYSPDEITGVVTADADGQHCAADTLAAAKALEASPGSLIIGTRNFSAGDVPLRNATGNRITSFVFLLLYGKMIHDTQTGLRAIPYGYLRKCLSLEGERYEYEINMLISAVNDKLPIEELPIQTIYIEGNKSSHYNVLRDSFRIYKVLFGKFFGFSLSGILSFAVDIGLYSLLTKFVFTALSDNTAVFGATALARIVSSMINYTANKNLVFKSGGKTSVTLAKYYALCALQMLASFTALALIRSLLSIPASATSGIKIAVDAVLFLISYGVQRKYIFK
ncbi:MAG: glycosyltransferase [Eubacteriaceae bacterium]|nr:glycosyltransferase [Eubacteriaceae bacterium]